MHLKIEFDREADGRWIAEIDSLPGVTAYGASRHEVESKVQAIALRTIADRLDRERSTAESVSFTLGESSGEKEKRRQILRELRDAIRIANPDNRDLVQELIAERRAEAARG